MSEMSEETAAAEELVRMCGHARRAWSDLDHYLAILGQANAAYIAGDWDVAAELYRLCAEKAERHDGDGYYGYAGRAKKDRAMAAECERRAAAERNLFWRRVGRACLWLAALFFTGLSIYLFWISSEAGQ